MDLELGDSEVFTVNFEVQNAHSLAAVKRHNAADWFRRRDFSSFAAVSMSATGSQSSRRQVNADCPALAMAHNTPHLHAPHGSGNCFIPDLFSWSFVYTASLRSASLAWWFVFLTNSPSFLAVC